MSEKQVEIELSEYLKCFPQQFIYYNPSEHDDLKEMFSKSSKHGSGRGIPDRIYYDGERMIIFECKRPGLLDQAKADVQHYIDSLQHCNLEVYGVAFSNGFVITSPGKKCVQRLVPETFGISRQVSVNPVKDVSRAIRAFHNLLRNTTSLPNEDRPLFVCALLIALQNENFSLVLRNYVNEQPDSLANFILSCLQVRGIDTNVYRFLVTNLNNVQIYSLCDFLQTRIINVYTQDLLSIFYTEFTRYQNSDSKTLGIVLTPDHVASMMIDLLDIQEDDVFLDPCTGTGTFLLKARAEKRIGFDIQTKLVSLASCNAILCKIPVDVQLCDFFSVDTTEIATKSAINPPYSVSRYSELDFIMKQMKSLKPGGLGVSIIPIGKWNNSKRNALLKFCTVRKVVKLNPKVFYPMAGVECVVVLLEKKCPEPDYMVQYFDFSDNVLVPLHTVKMDTSKEWWFDFFHTKCFDSKEVWRESRRNRSFVEYMEKVRKDQDHYTDIPCREYRIRDIFDIVEPRDQDVEKEVYLITARKCDNGIRGIVKTRRYHQGNKIVLVTGGDGGAGMAFYQEHDFVTESSTRVLAPKPGFDLKPDNGYTIATLLSKCYKTKYSRGYGWSRSRILKDLVFVPIDD